MKISLRAARVNAEISAAQAAKNLQIHPSTLYRWERRLSSPSAVAALALCALYNVSLNVLFLGKEYTYSGYSGDGAMQPAAKSGAQEGARFRGTPL